MSLQWSRRLFVNSRRRTARTPRLELLENRETPAAFSWKAVAADAAWNNAANWTLVSGSDNGVAGIPDAGDDAQFNAVSNFLTVNLTGPITVGNLSFTGTAAGFNLTGASLTLTGSLTQSAGLNTITANLGGVSALNVFGTGSTVINGQIFDSSFVSQNRTALAGSGSLWRLDETSATTAVDVISGQNGTYVNMNAANLGQPSGPAGDINTSAAFNGTNNYLTLPAAAFNNINTDSPISFGVWFKTSGSGVILGQTASGSVPSVVNPGGYVPMLYVGVDGRLRSELSWSGGVNPITSAGAVNDGQWHFALTTYGGGTRTLYLDGATVGTQTSLPQSQYSPTYSYYLGTGYTAGWPSGNAGWHYFNGGIDEPAVYTSTVSAATALSLYNAGHDGSVSLVKNDAGTLTLGGTNLYAAGTTINGGTLQVGNGAAAGTLGAGSVVNNGTLAINRSDTYTLSQQISGNGGLNQNGSGVTVLTAANTYSGPTNINAGTLRLATPTLPVSFQLQQWFDAANAGSVVQSGGFVTGWNDLSGNARNFAAPGTTANQPTLAATGINGLPAVQFDGDDQLLSSYNPGNVYSIFTVSRMTGGQNFRLITAGNNWLMGYWGGAMNVMHNANWITPGGVGPVPDTATHFYNAVTNGTGSTTAFSDGSTLIANAAGGATGPQGLRLGSWPNGPNQFTEASKGAVSEVLLFNRVLTVSEIAAINTYLNSKWTANFLNDNSAVTVAGGATLDLNGISETIGTLSGAGTVTLGGATLSINESSDTVFSGGITGSGNVLKLGSGNLTLSGSTSTYGGTTTVSAGTLTASGGSAIPNTSAVAVNNGATLGLSSSETIGSLTGGGSVNLGSSTLSTGADNTSTQFAGTISGATGGLTKVGSGTFMLTAANTYGGATTVSAGTLKTGVVLSVLSQLQQWVDAANVGSVVQSGGFVTGWNDLSGNGRNLSAPVTTANQPILNATGMNGLPAIQFDGDDQLLSSYNPGNVYSIFTVSRMTGGQNLRLITAGNNWLMGYWGGAMNVMHNNGWLIGPGGPVPDTNVHYYNAVTNGTGSSTAFSDASTLIATAAGGQQGPNGIRLGSWPNGSQFTEGSKGAVSEVVLYNRVLSAAEIAAVNLYLTVKWGGGAINFINDASPVTVAPGATLDLGSAEAVGTLSGGGNVLLNGTLTVNEATDTSFTGNISGNGGLVKAGAGTLTLSGTNTYSGATAVTGGGLTVSGGAAVPNTSDVTLTGATLTLNSSETIGSLAGSGTVSLGTNTLTTGGSGASTTFTGAINGSTGAMTKTGAGVFTLGSGASTNYSGVTTISAGTLKTTAANVLSDTSAVVVGNSGVLDIGANETIPSLATDLTTSSGAGVLLTAGTLTTGGAPTTDFAGVISGPGNLTKVGSGTFLLSGNNTLSGTTTISAGVLQIGNGGPAGSLGLGNVVNDTSLVYNVTGTTLQNGAISGPGSVTKNGSGTVVLTASNTYGGGTTVNAGTLKLGGSVPVSLQLQQWFDATNAGSIIQSGGLVTGWNDLSGNARDFAAPVTTLNQPTLNATGMNGQPAIQFDGNDQLLSSYNPGNVYSIFTVSRMTGGQNFRLLTAGNNWLMGYWGGAMNVMHNAGWLTSPPGVGPAADTAVHFYNAVTNATGSNTIFSDGSTLIASGAGGQTGPQGLRLGSWPNGANQFTEASKGAVSEVLLYNRVLSAAEIAAVNNYLTSKWSSAAILSDTGSVTVNGGTLDVSVAETIGPLSGSGAVVLNNTLTVNETADTSFSGNISGPGGLTKSGGSTLTLSGNNTYSGNTNVSAGGLTAAGGSAIGDSSAVSVTSTLTLTANETIGSLTGAGSVVLGTNTLSTGANNTSTTFSGTMTGSTGGLTKVGTGTFTLGGSPSYSGATTVSAGTLKTAAANIIPDTSAVVVGNAGTIEFVGSDTIASLATDLTTSSAASVKLTAGTLTTNGAGASTEFAGIISGPGDLTKAGAGTLILSGANTFSGTTTVDGGVLQVGNGGPNGQLGAGPVVTNASLIFNTSGTITQLGAISGPGSVTKTGSGSLLYTSSNTYLGGTTVSQGTLKFSPLATLPVTLNLQEWFDASNAASVVQSGGFVTQWNDINPNAPGAKNLLAPAASANQPTLVPGAINGLPVIRFDGNDVLSNTYNSATPYTIITVSKMQGTQNGRLITARSNNWLLGYWMNNMDQLYAEGSVRLGGGPVPDTNVHIYGATGTGSISTLYDRTTQIASNAAGLQAPNGLSLGAWQNNPTNEASKGDIGEVLLFNRVLTAGEYASVVNYLSGKWSTLNYLADAAAVTVAPGATLDLNGFSETMGAISGGGAITLGGGTLTVNQTVNSNFAGNISGTGDLIKFNSGTMTLSGTNTYTGLTNITTGTISVAGGSALPDTTRVNLPSGTTLDLASNETVGSIAGAGNVTVNTSILSTGGDNTSSLFSGVISGTTGGLTKLGSGTFTLTNANTYAGPTTVAAGVLKVSNVLPVSVQLQEWFDAANTATVINSGGNISAWNDATGNGRNLSVAQGVPTYVPNAINGLPVVRFDGASRLTNTYDTGNPYTIISVSRMQGTQNQRLISGVNNNWLLGYWQGRQDVMFAGAWVSPGGGAGPAVDTAVHFYGATNTGSINTFFSGSTVIASNNAGLQSMQGLSLGGLGAGAAAFEISKGDVAEVLVYNRVLSASEYAAVLNYLNIKWGSSGSINFLSDASNLTVLPGAVFDTDGNSEAVGSIAGGGDITMGKGSLTANQSTNTTFGGTISGAGGLTKNGAGTLVLAGNNTYTGNTSVTAGTLQVGNGPSAALASPSVSVAGGATLSGAGGVLAGNVSLASGATLSPGTVGTAGSLTVAGSVSFAGGSTLYVDVAGIAAAGTDYDQLTVQGGVTITAGAQIFGSTPPVTLANGGSLVVLNNTTAAALGNTFNNVPEGPAVSTIGGKTYTATYVGGVGANDLVLTAIPATRVWSGLGGNNNWSTNANWVGNQSPFSGDDVIFDNTGVSANGTPNNDMPGLVPATLSIANTTGSYTFSGGSLTVSGSVSATSSVNNTLNMPLAGAAGVAKFGAGTLTLIGANTYTGPTSVANGALIVNGSTAAASAVSVSAGTLAGTGTIGGTVTASGSGRVSPGTDTLVGTLTITGNLLLNGTSTLYIQVDGLTANDKVVVGGSATINAAGATLAGVTVTQRPTGSPAFLVIDAASGFSGTFQNATLQPFVTLPSRNYSYEYEAGFDFLLTAIPSTVEWDGNGGAGDNLWSNPLNWVGDNIPQSGDTVLFGNLGLAKPSTQNDLGAGILLGVRIENTSGAYTLAGDSINLTTLGLTESGAGGAATVSLSLVGSNGVTVSSGALTLSSTGNTYAGATTISGGSLSLGASGVIPDGAGKGVVNVGGTFNVAGFTETINGLTGTGAVDNTAGAGSLLVGAADTSSTFSGVLQNTAGTLALTKIGTGTLTLAGSSPNAHAGTTTVADGILALAKSGAQSLVGPITIGDADNNLQPANVKTAILRIDANEQISNSAAIAFNGDDGRLLVSPAVTETIASPTTFAQGDVKIQGTLISTGDFVQDSGTTTLAGGVFRAGIAGTNDYALSGILQGSGTIYAKILTSTGTIDPSSGVSDTDFGNASPGRITIRGNLQMTGSSVTNLDIGAGGSDQLNVGINTALPLPAGSYTNLSNYDLDPYLRGDVLAVTEPGRRGVNDLYNINGTVRLAGTLNTRPIGAAPLLNNGSYGNSMNFVWRALNVPTGDLDPRGANLSSVPSDFDFRNSFTSGGVPVAPNAPAGNTRFEPRFMGSAGQANAIGQSVSVMTKLAGVDRAVLTAPAYIVGQAKALTLTPLTAPATSTPNLKMTKQVWNALRDSHTRVTVTVTNSTGAALTGPFYLEITSTPFSVPVFNQSGKTQSNKPYLVVVPRDAAGNALSSLANGATATVEVDLLTPVTLGKTTAITANVLFGGLP